MLSATLALAAAGLLLSAPPVEPGTQFTYAGQMVPAKDDGDAAIKKFSLTYIAFGSDEGSADLAWVLDESGRGSWTWLDHFGRSAVALARSASEESVDASPALLYERAEGKSVVPIIAPLFVAPKELAKDAAWEEGRLEYKVLGQATKAGRMCWEINIRSPYGHKRTLWVDQGSPLVVAVNETVFIGQGDEHKLTFTLTESKQLEPGELDRTTAALESWVKLREQLGWKSRDKGTELSDEQIATLKAELPKVAENAAGPLDSIAAAAAKDATGQKNRAGAVAALREAAIGQPLGPIKLDELSGKPVTHEDLAGKVVVLHFWEYRDTPLEEPYGQIGYLDYLSRRRGEAGVLVYGVNVDPRLGDEETRRASIGAARKLKAFMNLSFPVLLDEGTLLKRLGDPRRGGGKLPLFIVVGKDGKIAEYHAGLYDVNSNEGLAELNAVIEKQLK
jgi:hypothetical protein